MRLVEPLDASDDFELFVQKGSAGEQFPDLSGADYISKGEFVERLEWADVVITQGGAGAIYEACMAGHMPLVAPRRAHLDEHIDDHQWFMTRALAEQGRIRLLDDERPLLEQLQEHPPRRAEQRPERPLVDAVAQALANPRRRRLPHALAALQTGTGLARLLARR